MRGDCTEARIDEREARAKLALVRRNASVAAKRRKTIVVELPPEVKYRAAACGEARCAAALAKEKLLLWFRARGGETHVRKMAAKAVRASAQSIDNKQQQVWSRQRGSDLARLNERDDAELKAFDAEMDDCATRLRDAEEALKRVREELECEITKAEDDERARDQKPVAALDATDEEKAELRKEWFESDMPTMLGKIEDVVTETGSQGYAYGKSTSYADVVIWALLRDCMAADLEDTKKAAEKCTALNAIAEQLAANDGVAKYLKERPESMW